MHAYLDHIARSMPITMAQTFFILYLVENKKIWLKFLVVIAISEVLNVLLKKIIQQARPYDAGQGLGCHIYVKPNAPIPTSFGMPSGHAMTTATSLTLLYLYIDKKSKSKSNRNRLLPIFVTFLFVHLFVMSQRVVTKCHSIAQVVIGSILGMSLALLSFSKLSDEPKFFPAPNAFKLIRT